MKKTVIAALFALPAVSGMVNAQAMSDYCMRAAHSMFLFNQLNPSFDESVRLFMPFKARVAQEGDNANSRQCARQLKEIGIWPDAPLTPKLVHQMYLIEPDLKRAVR